MTEISNGRTVFVDKYIEALKKRGESRIVVFKHYVIFRSEITELKSKQKKLINGLIRAKEISRS